MQVLENEHLRIAVKPKGAELCSLFHKSTEIEHLWQADAGVWGKHAPILFPTIGELHEGKARFGTEVYQMSRHGFFRDSTSVLIQQNNDELVYELRANADSLRQYPFDFAIRVGYRLEGKCLTNWFEVENTGSQEMPFALGGHPAFAICHLETEGIDDYYLEMEYEERASRHLLNDQGLFNGETEAVFENSKQLPLSETLFDKDALVFKDLKSRSVQLRSKQHLHGLRFNFEQWPYLGIWAKPGAHFVCIEPWAGCADSQGFDQDFSEKEQVIILKANGQKRLSFWVEVF